MKCGRCKTSRLSVEDGEFITVIGSNGAGKSTLFNVISGAVQPHAGRIELDGHDITYKTGIPALA